ncbi:MAG: tRNA (adenosine(37)-N6)-dimethylallyltransferase MiaA, partial [Candidatus Zixiibacteriota bacterium]
MGVSEQLRIPIICGPTASGKTGVAMDLAGEYAVEIISADSRQIIKYLDIGTAKPTIEEQRKVSFHLIDLIEPGERYSAVRFLVDSDRAVSDILNRGHIPLVVGGTGLYLRALTEGVVKIEENDNPELREKLQRQMEELGPEEMHRRLAELDPDEAARIHPNNKVRVIRALEICELAGQSKTTLVASGAYKKSKYEYEYFCLVPPRDELYA